MEETILLNFEVDQTKAQNELVKTEKNIISLKKEQAALNKEYKAGKITEDEYVKSNIKLQQSIKKEVDQKNVLNKTLATESNSRNAMRQRVSELNREYNNLNLTEAAGIKRADELGKELSQLNNELNKGSKAAGQFKDNIGNYPEKLGNAAKSINVAGTSVGSFASQAAGLISPLGAAAGVVSLLGSAFLSTRDGAELLEAAQFKLQAGFQILGRETGKLVTVTGNLLEDFFALGSDEDGSGGIGALAKKMFLLLPPVAAVVGIMEGLDKVTGGYITKINKEVDALAAAKGAYDDLLRSQIEESEILSELDRQIEVLKTEREEENTTTARRIELDKQVLGLETDRFQIVVAGAIKRRDALEVEADLLGGVNKLTDTQLQLLISSRNEVKNLEAEYATRIRKIKAEIDNLNKALKEELTLNEAVAAANKRIANETDVKAPTLKDDPFLAQIQSRGEQSAIFDKRFKSEQEKRDKEELDRKKKYEETLTKFKEGEQKARLQQLHASTQDAAVVFGEQSAIYKAGASAETLIATYASAQKAFDALAGITVVGPALGAAAAALAITAGLARVAAINNVEFAEGGWTGPGKKWDPVGVVHADEYVTPKHIVNSPAAQPHIQALEQMRLRPYADGGFVTNQNIAASQQALIMANAVKNLPQPVVSWTEGRAVGRRVEAREKVARI